MIWADYMDLVPLAEQERELKRAGINPDPATWDADTTARAAAVLDRIYQRAISR